MAKRKRRASAFKKAASKRTKSRTRAALRTAFKRATLMSLRTIEFDKAKNARVIRDRQSNVHSVLHTQKPVVIGAANAVAAAANYLHGQRELLGLNRRELKSFRRRPQNKIANIGVEYRFLSEKRQFDLTTVTFQQTCLGLPVWQAGISVHLKQLPNAFEVVAFQTTRHEDLTRDGLMPAPDKLMRLKALNAPTLAQQLGIADKVTGFDPASLRIRHQKLMIYRYEEKKRSQSPELANSRGNPYAMELPPILRNIVDRSHSVVSAVYFDLKRIDRPSTHWLALVDAATLSILYLEELAAGVRGKVFQADPMTMHGSPWPSGSNSKLNPLRAWAALPNLQNTNPQKLSGSNVKILDFDQPPANSVPSEPTGTDFQFSARSDEFAAVSAYYNCDRFFGLLENLGFKRANYFPNQTFPIEVDPRGWAFGAPDYNSADAETRATTHVAPDGSVVSEINNIVFQLADPNDPSLPLGLACDWRVVLHELGGHGTLLNHINSSRFNFAHSAGDSFAAILNDPESKVKKNQKGRTFPWLFKEVGFDRQHDRKVKDGWAWGGSIDLNDGADQLGREQILSSTHFRLYKSIGGGDKTRADIRWFAARYTCYLILQAIQSLTPATTPPHASNWMDNLIIADSGDWTSEGQSGGAYEKVIHWAFEKQGLFGGNPPDVDVYINDGRYGEYDYNPDHEKCTAIWNRRTDDGLDGHQAPVPNVENYAYVKIKNRGSQTAKSVVVNAYQNKPYSKLVYPNDWHNMLVSQLGAPDVPPSSEVKVGPFKWLPTALGENFILMAVSATDDASNLGKYQAARPIPDWRLVPNDNNLGMRKV